MTTSRHRATLALAAAGLWLSPDSALHAQSRPLGPQCYYNSDCGRGLICAEHFCSAQCHEDRDCPDNKVCQMGWWDATDTFVGPVRGDEALPAYGVTSPSRPGEVVGHRCVAAPAQPARAGQSRAPVIAPPFEVIGAGLIADQAEREAPCPATMTFTGWISASSPGVVTYRVRRSDGGTGAIKTMSFSTRGRQAFRETWTVAATIKGSLTLEVLTPTRHTSLPAASFLQCGK